MFFSPLFFVLFARYRMCSFPRSQSDIFCVFLSLPFFYAAGICHVSSQFLLYVVFYVSVWYLQLLTDTIWRRRRKRQQQTTAKTIITTNVHIYADKQICQLECTWCYLYIEIDRYAVSHWINKKWVTINK